MTTTTPETSILPRLPFTKKIHQMVDTMVDTMHAGLAVVPRYQPTADGAWVTYDAPYFIVYPLWGDLTGGTWNSPDADVEWFYQVTMVSERPDQLEWMRDRLLGMFLARQDGKFVTPIDVAGMSVMNRRMSDDPGGTPAPAGSVMQSDLRLGFKVTPKT